MQHTPKLHIFIGQFNHFFTLRESYLHTYYVGRINPKPVYEVRYAHLKNLSQNWEEAVEKAKEASKNLGIELHIRDSEVEQLDEIKRVTAEEAEQRLRLAQEEYAKAEEEAQERRRNYWNIWKKTTLDQLQGIKTDECVIELEHQPEGFVERISGKDWTRDPNDPEKFYITTKTEAVMPFGAYAGQPLKNVPASYMQWLVHKSELCEIDAEETMHKAAFVAQWIRDNIEIKEPTESNWVGTVGEKIEINVTVDSVRSIDGYYGQTYLYRLLDEEGNQLTWFASRPALAGKTHVRIRATVKKHDEYKGTKQTLITRAKVM